MAGNVPGHWQIDAPGYAVVTGQLEADDKGLRAFATNSCDQFPQESGSALEVPAVFVLPVVGPGREKLVKKVSVAGRNFNAGEAGASQASAAPGPVFDHVIDFGAGQYRGHGPAQIVGQGRCAHRAVVATDGMTAAA